MINKIQPDRIILGLDPGTAIVGFGIIKKSGSKISVLNYGCIRTNAKTPIADRLEIIYRDLSDIIKKEKPSEVAIEELFYFKSQKTVISVAEARGALLVCARNHQLPVYEYTPLQIKQALTGYGRADKKQMQEMVRVTCKLDVCPKPDDAADAIAIAICHSGSAINLQF